MLEVSPSIRSRVRWPQLSAPRGRLAFGMVIVLAIALTAVKYFGKAEKPSRTGELTRTAFLRWRPQIQALETRTNIYEAFQYPNPPIMALILYPFTELPPLVGAMTWFAVKAILAGLMFVWALRLLAYPVPSTVYRVPSTQYPVPSTPFAATVAAVLLALHPILGDLAHGNVNIFIGFLIFASLALFCRRWDFSAGLVLALAIACKVTPALFVPYFVWKRYWRAVLGTIVGLGLWLAVVPAAAIGWEYNRTLLTSWYEQMVKPFVVEGKVTSEHPNQSIPGLVFRLLTAEPSFMEYDDDDGRAVPSEYHNLASLSPSQAQLLVKSLMLVFAAGVVWLCRWPAHRANVPRAGPMLAAEFGLILVGMLLFSERTWKHHAVTLIVPFAVLAWATTVAEVSAFDRRLLRITFALIGLLTVVPSLLNEQTQDLAMVYGSSTAAFSLTAAAMVYILARVGRIPPQAT